MARLFVYGTLMPGHLRWEVLEPHALGWWPAACEGLLFDSGQGWPAAVFEPGPDLVRGWAVDLAPEVADVVLAHLDDVEGVGAGWFRRVGVELLGGEPAEAYELADPPGAMARIGTWEGREER